MQCFICGAEVGKEHNCYNCGADILLYRQIVYTSYVYYNQGLEKARVKDISGAIDSLKTSLQYFKYNTRARNLLGLCYYQIGEFVRALDEWVISKNLEDDNPEADRYLAEIENDPGLMNRLNSTIKKYNQAIEYCKAGSRDLAMIQLKKVISQNPNLVKAHQLLALLYIQEKKYADARKLLAAANKIDTNNTTTIRYIHEVKECLKNQNTSHRRKKNDIVTFADGNDTVIMSENSFKNMIDNSKSSMVNIILGIVIGLLICYFLIVPTVKENTTENNTSVVLALNERISDAETTNKDLEEDIEKLKNELAAYEDMQDITTSYDNLFATEELYQQGEIEAACEKIQWVSKAVLGEAGQQSYDRIYALLAPTIIADYYNEGNAFYLDENYENAITNLRKVVEIDPLYGEGAAMFLLGDSLRLTGENGQAVDCFKQVVETFPSNQWGKQAQTYIDADGSNTTARDVSNN